MRAEKNIYVFCFVMMFYLHLSAQNIQVDFLNYKIKPTSSFDSNYIKWLQPYADSMHSRMNIVIGFSVSTLVHKQPESSLGNFMVDAMKLMAEKKFNMNVDAAFINSGGIRSYLPKGDITLNHVYQIMPFDNLIVLQKIRGDVLLNLINKTAEEGAWPVSGITMTLKNRKAENILINHQPIDLNKEYVIANTDYIANGGGGCSMLKNIPKMNKGYLLRDALIEYISSFTKQSKPIEAILDNRIIYVP
jgi:2',3'-cyclic-nucleotide 2'-phosphodiesterase (5'-nucleotidase family)